jgi:hypothetical protein
MVIAHTKKITSIELIKLEKKFNGKPTKYFYNIGLEGIDELLLLEVEQQLNTSLTSNKVKFKINDENEVIDFEFI